MVTTIMRREMGEKVKGKERENNKTQEKQVLHNTISHCPPTQPSPDHSPPQTSSSWPTLLSLFTEHNVP